MAKDKRKESTEDVKKNIEKLLPQVTSNYRVAKTAEFFLRMLSKNGSRGMNLVISDKDFTKKFINYIEISDRIQEKLVSRMGDADLVTNIKRFQDGIKKIDDEFKTFINGFLEDGIGHGKDLEKYQKEKATETPETPETQPSSIEEKEKTA